MLRFCTDSVSEYLALGWAFSEDGSPVEIEVRCNGVVVGRSRAILPRSDVRAAYPQFPSSGTSGFSVKISGVREINTVTLEVLALEGDNRTVIGSQQILPIEARLRLKTEMPLHPIQPSAFPQDVLATILTVWPETSGDDAIADKICTLATSNVQEIPSIIRYARFLRAVSTHFQFVQRYFPAVNSEHSDLAIDVQCKANSPQEMLSIANQLYVLKSYGVIGDFAEFGCFKGYSSAMLSHACSLLGIRMLIFDSFEGLPESASTFYRKGDFAGGFDEVARNVDLFGSSSAVVYHRGYFSDSLRRTEVPTLMALWMDVDLETSARDVMTVAHKVDPRGAIFSHECAPEDFTSDLSVVMPNRDPDRVIRQSSTIFLPLKHRLSAGFYLAIRAHSGGETPDVPLFRIRRYLKSWMRFDGGTGWPAFSSHSRTPRNPPCAYHRLP